MELPGVSAYEPLSTTLGRAGLKQSVFQGLMKNNGFSMERAFKGGAGRFTRKNDNEEASLLPDLFKDHTGELLQKDEEIKNTELFVDDRDGDQNHIDNSVQDDTLEIREKSVGKKSVIDKETYKKITEPVIRQGADIRIAEGKVLERIKEQNSSAVTYGDVLFLLPDATVSDVLEETYHFLQNKKGLNDQYGIQQRTILNEIDAKEYLLRMTEKYKIPANEVEVTKRQLASYKAQMEDLKKRGEWYD